MLHQHFLRCYGDMGGSLVFMVRHVNVKRQLKADSLGQGGQYEQGVFFYSSCLFPSVYQGVGLWGHERKAMLGHLWKQRGKEGVRRSRPMTDSSS